MNKIILTLGIILFSLTSYAQVRIVTGTITDEFGELLPGVNIIVKGTNQGVVSDMQGNFEISVSPNVNELQISYSGMKTINVSIIGKTTLQITLESDLVSLDELVVVGYGSVKKSSLTASVSKLEGENIDKIAVGRVDEAMVGQLPGLSIRQTKANPGENPAISIRGTSTINGSNEPLIVIDGFPGGDLSTLNSGDIESIEVLKDASSAAIYGSRAASGVIIVTTKMGKNKKPVFSFSTYTGAKTAINIYDDVMNSEEAYQYSLKNLSINWINDGGDPNTPVTDRPIDYQPNELKRTFADTKWQDEILRTGIIQNYELSARGGSDFLNYYVSGSYMDEEGVMIVGNYKRYSVRANLVTSFSKKIEMGLNLEITKTEQERFNNNLNSAIKYPSYIPVYLPEGEISLGGIYAYNRYYFGDNTNQTNPVAKTLGTSDVNNRIQTQVNSYLSYNIMDGMKFKTSLGAKYRSLTNPYFQYSWGDNGGTTQANWDYRESYNVLNENILTYSKTINNDHDFDVLLGASYQKQKELDADIAVMDGSIPDNRIQTLNVGIVSEGTTFKSEWGLVSYFGRLKYAYKSKYLLAAAYRTDGSSRFGKANKWGVFPSLSLGWNVHKEKFMEPLRSVVSSLKFRGSYGLTGRTPDGYYDPIARVLNYNYSLGTGNGSLAGGATQGTFGNSELQWEKTKEFDLGLDLGLFKRRIELTADVYQRNTTDLLLYNPIPSTTGFAATLTNIGEISNKGIELALHTRNLVGDFKWETNLIFSKNINEVVDLGGLESLPLVAHKKGMWFQTKVGQPIGQYFGWVQEGVWANDEEIANNPHAPDVRPGSLRVKDMNNDGEIDEDDRAGLGSYMPDFEFGISNTFNYKNIDLSVFINGVIGFEVYNYELQYYENNRKFYTDNQWFSPTELGNGKVIGNDHGVNAGSTDYYIEDGSYWGVRNITLGYTIPNEAIKGVFDSARIYVAVQNALFFTIKDFHAYNPEGITESGDLQMQGVNLGSEPIGRTISLGFNLNF